MHVIRSLIFQFTNMKNENINNVCIINNSSIPDLAFITTQQCLLYLTFKAVKCFPKASK